MKEQLIARIKAAADDATHQGLWNEGLPYRKNFFHPTEYKKRSEYLLSSMLNEGVDSPFIWNSFLHVPHAEQQLYLNRNPELKRYKRLHDLLKNQNVADPRNRPQTALVNFIAQHPTFVANQLQFDADLRRHFFFLLTHANPTEFKPLLKLITKTPALATEFENNVTQELNPSEDKKDRLLEVMNLGQPKPVEDPVFKEFQEKMGRSLLVRDEILTAVLTAGKEKFSPEFIAEVALHRQGNIEQYRSKLNSKLWRAGNFIKLWLLPSIIAQFFEPPITKETVEKMSTIISRLDQMASQDPAPAEDEIPLTVFHPNDKIRFTGFRRLLQPVDPNNEHSVVPSDAEDHTSDEDERDIAAAGQQQAQQDAIGAEGLAIPANPVAHAIPPFQAEQNDPARANLAVHAAGALPPIEYPPAVPTQPGKEAVSASPSSYVSLNDVIKQGRKEARKQERAAKKKNVPIASPAAPEDDPDENSPNDASFFADLLGTRSQHDLELATVVSPQTSSKVLNAASSPKITSANNIVAQAITPATSATLVQAGDEFFGSGSEDDLADNSLHDASFFADLLGAQTQNGTKPTAVASTRATPIKSSQALSAVLASPAATPVQADDKLADSGSEEDLKDTSNNASFFADLFTTRTQKEVKPAQSKDRVFDFSSEEDLPDNSTDFASVLADLLGAQTQNATKPTAVASTRATPIKSSQALSAVLASPAVTPVQADDKLADSGSEEDLPDNSTEFASLLADLLAPVGQKGPNSPALASIPATPVRSEPNAVTLVVPASPAAPSVSPSIQPASSLAAEENQSDESETEEQLPAGLFDSPISVKDKTPVNSSLTTPVKLAKTPSTVPSPQTSSEVTALPENVSHSPAVRSAVKSPVDAVGSPLAASVSHSPAATPVKSETKTVSPVVPLSPPAALVSSSVQSANLSGEGNQTDASEVEELPLAGLFDSPISVIDKTPVGSALTTPVKLAKAPGTVASEVKASVDAVPSPIKADSVVHSPAVRSAVKPPVDTVASPLKAVSVTHSPAVTSLRSEPKTVSKVVPVSPPATPTSSILQPVSLTVEENPADRSETEEHALRGLFDSVILAADGTPVASTHATPIKSAKAPSDLPSPRTSSDVHARSEAAPSTPKVDTPLSSASVKSAVKTPIDAVTSPIKAASVTPSHVVPVSPAAPSVFPSIPPASLSAEENQSDESETEDRLPANLFDSPVSVTHQTSVDSTLATPIKLAKAPSTVPSPQTSSEVAVLPEAAAHSTLKAATPATSVSRASEVKTPFDATHSPLKAGSVSHSPATTPVKSEPKAASQVVPVSSPATPVLPSAQPVNLTAEDNQADASETEELSLAGLLDSPISVLHTTPVSSTPSTPITGAKAASTLASPQTSSKVAVLPKVATPPTSVFVTSEPFKADSVVHSPAVRSAVKPPVDAIASPLKAASLTHSPAATSPVKSEPKTVSHALPVSSPAVLVSPSVQSASLSAERNQADASETEEFSVRSLLSSVIIDTDTSPAGSTYTTPVKSANGSSPKAVSIAKALPKVGASTPKVDTAHPSPAVQSSVKGLADIVSSAFKTATVGSQDPWGLLSPNSSAFFSPVVRREATSVQKKNLSHRPALVTSGVKSQATSGARDDSEAASVILDQSEAVSVGLDESEAAPLELTPTNPTQNSSFYAQVSPADYSSSSFALSDKKVTPFSDGKFQTVSEPLNNCEAAPVIPDDSDAESVDLDESEAAPLGLDESEAAPLSVSNSKTTQAAHRNPDPVSEAKSVVVDGSGSEAEPLDLSGVESEAEPVDLGGVESEAEPLDDEDFEYRSPAFGGVD